MNRREFLTASGGLLPALTCCLGMGSQSCGGDLTQIDHELTIEREQLAGFTLTLSKESVARGGQIMARLRNVTDEDQSSGNRYKYDIQRQTAAGWRSIFQIPKTSYWTDEGLIHPPDTGLTWNLRLTQNDLERTDGQPDYYVCEPVVAGTYRFVYWGITPEQEAQGNEYALGSIFVVTES